MKVPYVQRIRRPDGRLTLYFRKAGYREGPLRSPDGSPELKVEVDSILRRLKRADAARTPTAGTVGGLVSRYRKSAEFISLAASTQKEYGRLLDEIETDVGEVLLQDLDAPWVRDLRDAWAPRGYKAANDRVQMLRNAFGPAIGDGRIKTDPFARLKKLTRPHGSAEVHPSWTDDEIEAAIGLAIERGKPGLARAIALGRWAGFRRGTICAIPLHAHITALDDDGHPETRLFWITEKRGVLCDKREDPRLTELLRQTPNKALTIAYNAKGEPWKARQLNQAIDRLMATLAKAGTVRAATDETGLVYCPLDIHGLRHARGLELALAGASDAEIMGQLEHASPRAAQIYRRQAQRKALADQGQTRIDNVVKLKAQRKGALPI